MASRKRARSSASLRDRLIMENDVIVTQHAALVDWKSRRSDRKTEEYWRRLEATKPLSDYEKYQQEWNFKETDYSDTPSNNGLDPINPSFAWTTSLAKHIEIVDVYIKNGNIIYVFYPKSGQK